MRDRLKLSNLDQPTQAHARRDTIPFPPSGRLDTGHSPFHAPFHAWAPREHLDTIAHVESALEHAERQLSNLRALLGMDAPEGDDHRAA